MSSSNYFPQRLPAVKYFAGQENINNLWGYTKKNKKEKKLCTHQPGQATFLKAEITVVHSKEIHTPTRIFNSRSLSGAHQSNLEWTSSENVDSIGVMESRAV